MTALPDDTTKRDLTAEAVSLLNHYRPDLAEHVQEMDRLLNSIAHPAWKLATWTHHNYTYNQMLTFRDQTVEACMEAEPYIERKQD